MLGGSCVDRLCTPSVRDGPFRIFAVAGFQNRVNDVVYCPPVIRQMPQKMDDSTAVVYFGGDVQDFPESMETNRDSRGYLKYNLENSAVHIRRAFPHAHVVVIRPSRMEFKTFSCFDNFVRGNNAGVPDHTPMNHALQHMEKLLQNLSQRLTLIPEDEIRAQAAQAAAAAAAMAAAAALVSSTLSTASSDSSSSSSSASDNSQDMDIDILQVQENVTVDADGAVIFPNVDGVTINKADGLVAVNSTNTTTVLKDGRNGATTTITTTTANTNPLATAGTTTSTSPNVTQRQQQQFCNNKNNCGGNCPLQQQHHQHNQKQFVQQHAQQQQQQQQEQKQCDDDVDGDENENDLWWRENLNLDKSKLILIGFSKGCVVLNQFIYEFHYLKTLTPDDSTMIRLLSRFKEMYWLDGGHGGQKNTWITSRSLLETLTRMALNIHVHLTPYQVQDDRRPWIRKEEKIFTDMLRRLGAQVTRQLHFETQTSNLMTHFEVLKTFCKQTQALNEQLHRPKLLQQQQQQQQQNAIEQTTQLLANQSQSAMVAAIQHQQQQQQQQQQAHEQQQQQAATTGNTTTLTPTIAHLNSSNITTTSNNHNNSIAHRSLTAVAAVAAAVAPNNECNNAGAGNGEEK